MATNDVLGKLGRSNIKSRGPLLWAEKQPNGSIREVLFLSFSLPRSLSQERENKWKLICIKCLSRQTCPLRGDHAEIPHPARSKRGGGDKVGWMSIPAWVCVVLIKRIILCLYVFLHVLVYFLVLSMHHIDIFLFRLRYLYKVSMQQDLKEERRGLLVVLNQEVIHYKPHNVLVVI